MSQQPKHSSSSAAANEEEEEDPVERMIRASGCWDAHVAMGECMAEARDWRKCQREVKQFRECMQNSATAAQKKAKKTAKTE